MVQEPAAMPETVPLVAPTVAIAGLLLVQVPQHVASDSVAEPPTHVLVLPVIGEMA